jgi:GTPase Era involved in 16S rRNA processing
MSSGRRERVVLSCVTFETYKIVDPIVHYAATKVHLIHYTDKSDARNLIYNEFYEQVCRMIKKNLPKAEIVEHESMVFDFTTMLHIRGNIRIHRGSGHSINDDPRYRPVLCKYKRIQHTG